MAAKRIRIEVCGNSNHRIFHVSTQVSAERLLGGFFSGATRYDPFHISSFGEAKKELGDDTKATVMRFYDIDGVNAVGLGAFEVSIQRSPAFEWEELEGDLIEAIKTTVNWQDNDIEIDYLFCGRLYTDGVSREVYETEMDRQRAGVERLGL